MIIDKNRVIVICGPTASGKSSTAIQVALQLDGEIVSADSMQIYRGMDIGTAKVSQAEQTLVRHHLIDCCDAGEPFSVARYKQLAITAIQDIQARGKIAIVCGGTGQYISALVQGIDYVELSVDQILREKLNLRAREEGLEALFEELIQIDPKAAAAIKPQDQKRIIRALEIYYQTGRTKTEHLAESLKNGPDFNYVIFCMTHQRDILYERINHRVQVMVDHGLVAEVQKLVSQYALPAMSPGVQTSQLTAWQAIGYKEVIAYLSGLQTLTEAVDAIATASRRYAKRQLTWFRKMDNVTWLHDLSPDQAASKIVDWVKNNP